MPCAQFYRVNQTKLKSHETQGLMSLVFTVGPTKYRGYVLDNPNRLSPEQELVTLKKMLNSNKSVKH